MTGEVRLEVFDAAGVEPHLDRLVEVYVEIYAEPDDAFHGADRYRRQIAGHLRAPGWRLVTATLDSELVGYAYGFTDEDGHRAFAVSERPAPCGGGTRPLRGAGR